MVSDLSNLTLDSVTTAFGTAFLQKLAEQTYERLKVAADQRTGKWARKGVMTGATKNLLLAL